MIIKNIVIVGCLLLFTGCTFKFCTYGEKEIINKSKNVKDDSILFDLDVTPGD